MLPIILFLPVQNLIKTLAFDATLRVLICDLFRLAWK